MQEIHPAQIKVGVETKYFKADFVACDLEQLSPIELSSEILEGCGFEKRVDVFDNEGLRLKMTNGVDDYELWHFFEATPRPCVALFHKSAMIGKNLYYLHQLQNIYHILTGQELEVNISERV